MSDRYAPRFGNPVTEWYRWFAWHPVDTVDRGWRWFRGVHRRRVQLRPYLSGPQFWFQHLATAPPATEKGTGQ